MGKRYPTFLEYLKNEYKGPYSATDIVIRYDNGIKEGVVLIERKFFPLGIAWPGGMAEYMTLSQNAIKEAEEETGLEVVLDDPDRPLCVFSEVNQDPRAFISSITYTGIGRGVLKPHKNEDAKKAFIVTLDELAVLLSQPEKWAFPNHHRKIGEKYLREVRYKK